MRKKIWTAFGVLWAVVTGLALAAVWTSTTDDLSSQLGNTAGVLAFSALIAGLVTLFTWGV